MAAQVAAVPEVEVPEVAAEVAAEAVAAPYQAASVAVGVAVSWPNRPWRRSPR